MKPHISDKVFFTILLGSVLLVLAVTGYKLLIQKDYNFVIEQECDPAIDTGCYERSCENDECPPNGIASYKIFEINANDFPLCSDNTCAKECESGIIECQQVFCDEEDVTSDVCLYYE